jgi:hypothetical protein
VSENPNKDSGENVTPEEEEATVPTEAESAAADDDADDSEPDEPKFGIAHAIGVSTPRDGFGPLNPSSGPMASDEALEDGVEPDFSPGPALFLGFIGMTVALLVIGYAVGNVFLAEARVLDQERNLSAVDPRLDEVRAAARAYTTEFAAHEASGESPALYQVPVYEAFVILESRPELFGGLPHGVATRGIDPPSRVSDGAAIGQDWTAAVLEDPPAPPVVMPDPTIAEGSGAEEGSGVLDSETGEPTLEPSADTE